MNLLLLLNAPHYLRPFVTTVRRLADRGHRVIVAWYEDPDRHGDDLVERFADVPTVTFETIEHGRSTRQAEVALLRRASNYLQYLNGPFRGLTKLRQRSFGKFIRLVTDQAEAAWSEAGLVLKTPELRRLSETLAYVESLIPADPACTEFLRTRSIDAVLVSPLVDLGSSDQVDWVKAAQALKIPAGMLVYSWDNLSTKGHLHVTPDRVFLWNLQQQKEAVRLHGVPAERVIMTGAPRFDDFLACAPAFKRSVFLEELGLDPAKSLVTYVCSSAFVSMDELAFIRRWLAALRASPSPTLRDCNVLVRPHPDVPLIGRDTAGRKATIAVDGLPISVREPFGDSRAVVVSTSGRTPQGLFECLYHSDAVVGLNTSAEIEAALLGKPVFSILAGEAADGQESTMHFYYLLKAEGGFVEVADSFSSHCEQLGGYLDASRVARRAVGRMLWRRATKFVRPPGETAAISDVLAVAIEREMMAAAASRLSPAPEGEADVDA